ncbi:B3 domain-containing transcription repressor VAL2 [Linum perenne]
MASKTCMNALCGASTSSGWRKGWGLRSGESAHLCDKCGSAYEQSIFCEVFHSKDSGWRECSSCGKVGANRKSNGFTRSRIDDSSEMQSISVDNGMDGDGSLLQLGNSTDSIGARQLLQLHGDDAKSSFSQMKQEARLSHIGEIGGTSFSHFNQASNTFSQATKPEINRAIMGAKDLYDSLAQTNLTIALGSSLGSPTPFGPPVDERAQSKTPPLQGSRSRHLLPKPPKSNLVTGLEPNNVMVSPIRVARPPAEGRGRNQLLPRYWPRITDQELQQISMDSNSTIVPLFEKVLSASDAGRIGRLVLPKACAEAYFPPISQPEGIPLRIQDVKGKEWVFQFRFWPNNNSRMYVLEGVTPCIQSMQLQAGDTVTFSRMDPEGKLVMGFRKASNSFAMQSLKGSNDAHLSALSKHLQSVSDISWNQSEKLEDRTQEGLMLPSSILIPERKKAKNIGSKNKRLLMDGQDALELKLTWEEAQDLLRPAPTAKPSIVTIEDHDFEEYEEPPVFGKRSIFVARSTGIQEQWAQCDGCSKWRRLPIDVLLPPKWTCSENAWDQTRCSCSAPDELTPRELENLLRQNKDFKKRRVATSTQEPEPSGLDALANAAILGDMGEPGTSAAAVATTTKHPRHRPGCSCIVCIQPPSGKGKHKPTCTCNVCMTVKRRFKTLMMRKKKRQSEREAEIAQRNQQLWGEAKAESSSKADASTTQYGLDHFENELEATIGQSSNKLVEMKSADNNGKGHIDLNCHPDREEDAQMTVMNLLQVASLPLEAYLKQNRSVGVLAAEQNRSVGVLASEQNRSVGSLVSEQNRSEPPHLPAVTAQEGGGNGDSEGQKQLPEHGKLEEDSAVRDCEENNQLETDKTQKGTE